MRLLIALYVGGMGSREKNFYNALVRRYGFEEAAQTVQDLYLDGKKDEAAAALPPELIDTVAIVGPRDKVRDRLAVYRDAGVGTLIVSTVAFDPEQRKQMVRDIAEMLSEGPRAQAPRRRLLLAAFGDPGHAFPAIALGGSSWLAATRSGWRPGCAGASTWRREGWRSLPPRGSRVYP